MPNQQLAQELQKVIIRKFEKRKAYWSLKDNISGVDLADIHLVSKYKKGFFFWLCFPAIYSKCTSVVPLKDKKRYYNY